MKIVLDRLHLRLYWVCTILPASPAAQGYCYVGLLLGWKDAVGDVRGAMLLYRNAGGYAVASFLESCQWPMPVADQEEWTGYISSNAHIQQVRHRAKLIDSLSRVPAAGTAHNRLAVARANYTGNEGWCSPVVAADMERRLFGFELGSTT